MTIIRADADGSDAVGSVIQENAEIVLISGAAGTGLPSTKPAFGSEVFEEGVETAAPVVISLLRG